MKALKINTENFFLIALIGILLWLGAGSIYNHTLIHEYPHGYMASDSFHKWQRTQALYETGFYVESPYLQKGYEDVVASYPPLIAYNVASISLISGLQPYDAMFLMKILYSIFAALCMYLIIRIYNKNIAILAMGILAFLYFQTFYIGYTWGKGPLIMGLMFLMSVFWSLYKMESKYFFAILATLMTAILFSHPSEAILAAIFITVMIFIKLFSRKLTKHFIRNLILAALISSVLSIYFIYIFLNSGYSESNVLNIFSPITDAPFPAPKILDFGLALIPISIGLAISIFTKKKKYLLPFILMILLSFTNYIGYWRAFHIRYLWPIYFSIFFGLGIYYTLKLILRRFKKVYSIGISVIILLLISGTLLSAKNYPGLANQYNWDGINWIKENTPANATTYFLYGDSYSQEAILTATFRESYRVVLKDYAAATRTDPIRKEYLTVYIHKPEPNYRKSLLEFGNHFKEDNYSNSYMNICDFDYYVLNKGGSIRSLAEFNIVLARELLNNSWFEEAYSNQLVSILRNNRKGVDCIGE